MAHDVFVSHSAKDKTTADAVCARLEAEGIRCWIAPRDILPGRDWGEAIVDAIEGCRVMVLIFSSHANTSVQIKREVERAVHKEKIIIPFRIEDVIPARSLEYFISTSHWLDAVTAPLEKHIAHLHKTVRSLLIDRDGQASARDITSAGPEIHIPKPEMRPRRTNAGPNRLPVFFAVTVLMLAALTLFYYSRHRETMQVTQGQQPESTQRNSSLSEPPVSYTQKDTLPPTWSEMLSKARRLRYSGRTKEALAAYSGYEDRFGAVYPSVHNYITAVQAFTIQKESIGFNGGVYIYEIMPEGAARKAGLDAGDIIVAYAGERTESTGDFTAVRSGIIQGEPAEIDYLRMDGAGHFQKKEVTVPHDVLGVKIMDF